MTNLNDSSSELWSELYRAAVVFRDLAPWTWMHDSDLFGGQSPVMGKIGYCAVLGSLGQMFALNVYLGSKGLAGYWRMADQADLPGSTRRALASVAGHQLCLMASFEDRAELDRRDLAVIKELRLRFRGRNQWPLFRNHRPGYLPWFLEAPEVQLLTVALQQATEIAQAVKRDPDYLLELAPEEDTLVLRVQEREIWRNVVHTPEPVGEPAPPPAIDEVLLSKIAQAGRPQEGVWLTDYVPVPAAIHEGERPYYPVVFPVLNDTGVVLHLEVMSTMEAPTEAPKRFLAFIAEQEVLPEALVVGSEEAGDIVGPVCEALGIPVHIEEDLPPLDEFIEGLAGFLAR